jgi:hypothetical protein
VTALTRDELLDIDPANSDTARDTAMRHAWNWAVAAETNNEMGTRENGAQAATVSQAWSAIAEALK